MSVVSLNLIYLHTKQIRFIISDFILLPHRLPHMISYILLFIDCTHILYHFYLFFKFHGVQDKTLMFLVRILFALQDECYIYAKITTVSCVFVAFIIIVVVMLLPSGYKNQFVICSSYKVLKHSNCVIVAYYQIVLFNFGQMRIRSQG